MTPWGSVNSTVSDERLRSIQTLAWEKDAVKDTHGRPSFPKERAEEFHSPIVSRFLKDSFRDIEYPGGKSYAVVLTHDIDLICPSTPRRMINSCSWMAKGKMSDSICELRGRSGIRHPYSDLKSIAQKEEERGGHSTFFVLNSPKDHTGAGYPIKDIAGQLDEVRRIGSEIGLHGSYDAGQSVRKILEEKEGIERVISFVSKYPLRSRTWRRRASSMTALWASPMATASAMGWCTLIIHPSGKRNDRTSSNCPWPLWIAPSIPTWD
jgi:hypothetical protein